MLVSYHGIVKNGKVELSDVELPDGIEVLVVTQTMPPSVAEQKKRLVALSDSEWRQPFAEYAQILKENPPEDNLTALSESELNHLVHEQK
jgi:hypothetical protein